MCRNLSSTCAQPERRAEFVEGRAHTTEYVLLSKQRSTKGAHGKDTIQARPFFRMDVCNTDMMNNIYPVFRKLGMGTSRGGGSFPIARVHICIDRRRTSLRILVLLLVVAFNDSYRLHHHRYEVG